MPLAGDTLIASLPSALPPCSVLHLARYGTSLVAIVTLLVSQLDLSTIPRHVTVQLTTRRRVGVAKMAASSQTRITSRL